jgi:Zn-finger nucleic acid-binding protein
MSRSAIRNAGLPPHKRIGCPRDKTIMRETPMGDAIVDVCGKCLGTFFDSGEMFAAAGIAADPSSWDRPETGGAVKEGHLRCPRCERAVMQAQDVAHEDKNVEIDRCGKCGGIWLDKDELDTIVAIGHALRPIVDAERAKAEAELEAMGAVQLRPVRHWKRWAVGALVVLLGLAAHRAYTVAEERRAAEQQREWNAEQRRNGATGCPCGCDHSQAMVAELRQQGGEVAPKAIAKTLATIAEREAAGYITERMIAHRLRMLDLAKELGRAELAHGASTSARCRVAPSESETLRVCPDLVVHGERVELVNGREKLITSSFRLWLEIENLTNEERRLELPSLEGGRFHLPVSRWYEEGGAGEPWDGTLGAHARVRVNVIGDIPEVVKPGVAIDASITLAAVRMKAQTEARAVIHLHGL